MWRLTVSGEEGDCGSHLAGTSSSPDTMDVILGVVWVIIVKHMSNVADIFVHWLARANRLYSNVPVSTSDATC